jgi:hypothetical protein
MQLCLKTKTGQVDASEELIEKLLKQGKLRDDMRCVSSDGGQTWVTYAEILEASADTGLEEYALADYDEEDELKPLKNVHRSKFPPFNVTLHYGYGFASDRYFRVYIHNDAIYFIRHKPDSNSNDGVTRSMAAQHGAAGGLVAGLLGQLFKPRGHKHEDWELDLIDPDTLLDQHKHNRKILIADIQSSVLRHGVDDGVRNPCQGRWIIKPSGKSKWKMDMPTVKEMRNAVSALIPTLGTVLEDKTVWSESRGKFIKRPN